jgi:hypothetical protein
VESQLLVFFKSSPDFIQESSPAMLQSLFILTYISLIFSVSSTISSLVLIKNFGNVPMLAARFQEKAQRQLITPRSDPATSQSRFSRDIAPRRWRLIEWHCMYLHVVGPMLGSLIFSTTRVVHASHVRAVSPIPDHLVHLDAREGWHKGHSLRCWHIFNASTTAFLAYS